MEEKSGSERRGLVTVIHNMSRGISELKHAHPEIADAFNWIKEGLSIVGQRVDELYQLAQKEDYPRIVDFIEGEVEYHPLRRLGEDWE